jgi:hypothetical protein
METSEQYYPHFSSFRQLMHVWDEAVDRQQIQDMIDGNNFVFFFKKKNEIFGAPEESRLIFAKIKNPDEEASKEWVKEASFAAVNFNRALQGEKIKNIFGEKDINDIKIMEKEEAINSLTKIAATLTGKKIQKDLSDDEESEPEDPAASPTINKVKER